MESNELYHYGRKGMKWYQNIFSKKKGDSSRKNRRDEDNVETKVQTKKQSIKDMTDDELSKAIKRAQMEDQYRSLRPEQITKGERFTKTVFDKVLAPATIAAGEQFLRKALIKMGDDALKERTPPNTVDKLKKEFEELDWKRKVDELKNPKAKELSWDDRIKEQTYNKNERNRLLEDLQREITYQKARKSYADMMKNTDVSDISDTLIDAGKTVVSDILEDDIE